MAVYIVTGKLGGGKSLVSVGRIRDKLESGCPVATNLDLKLHRLFNKKAKNLNVIRVPDKPTLDDLEAIGNGNPTYDEDKNGLLVLDECGTWFNARNWSDPTRKAVNDWFLHARKLGWDVMLIVQDIELLDSQARKAIAEHTVFCSRTDRLAIPVIGFLYRAFTGSRLPLPRVHSARVVYGTSKKDLLADRWVYRGTGLFAAYDTKQMFLTDYPHSVHSLLTPWHLYGRFQKPLTMERLMRLTKIHLKRFQAPIYLAAACFLGLITSVLAWPLIERSLDSREAVLSDDMVTYVPLPESEPEQAEQGRPSAKVNLTDDEPETLEDRFADWKLAAVIRNPTKIYYLAAGPEGKTLTDNQLRSMGYRVYHVDECELLVTDAEDMSDKVNLFLPGCYPSRGNARSDSDLAYFYNQ